MRTRLATIALFGAAAGLFGCKDFLTGGEVSNDPNRPTIATNRQLFVAIQANLWGYWGSDLARTTGILAQQDTGAQSQYGSNVETYQITEQNTSGFHTGLYSGGGLVDMQKLEQGTRETGDSLFLGIAQVTEAALMGMGADLFGDLVYSQALKNEPNPPLDDQLAVYDSVQKLLTAGIANMAAKGATNIGPGDADLVYGGDAAQWTALAHTLKARFFMHTGEVRPTAYASALAEARLGIQDDDDNYVGAFADQSGQQNFNYQFEVTAGRAGYINPRGSFVAFLASRNDPRRTQYFNAAGTRLSAARLAPDFQQPFVTYDENTLIWAEAAYRTNATGVALTKLNEERANHNLAPLSVAGIALLREILSEKYIANFQLGIEAWNDYKRTCFPNLAPSGTGAIPGRLFYDSGERQTDTAIPQPGTGVNGIRNKNDLVNATSDGTGAKCLGQF